MKDRLSGALADIDANIEAVGLHFRSKALNDLASELKTILIGGHRKLGNVANVLSWNDQGMALSNWKRISKRDRMSVFGQYGAINRAKRAVHVSTLTEFPSLKVYRNENRMEVNQLRATCPNERR